MYQKYGFGHILNTKKFNQYIVNFRSNQPLTIWAKQHEVDIIDGIKVHLFHDTHVSTKIDYINAEEVLYIQTARQGVELE